MKEKLIDQYFSLTSQYKSTYGEKTILLMQVGAFFEVYGKKHKLFDGVLKGSSIDDFCSICDLNKSNKAKVSVSHIWNGEKLQCGVVMAGFRDYVLEKYIQKLTAQGYTLPVIAQDETNPQKREEIGIFSPGSQFVEEPSVMNNHIMCVSLFYKKPTRFSPKHRMYFGISSIDVLTGETMVYECSEAYFNTMNTFDELERMYSILQPNEILFCHDGENLSRESVETMVQYIGVRSKLVRYVDSHEDTNLQEEIERNTEAVVTDNVSGDQLFSLYAHSSTKNKKMTSTTSSGSLIKATSQSRTLSVAYKHAAKQNYQAAIFDKHYEGTESDTIIESLYTRPCAAHSFAFLLDYVHTYNQRLTKHIRIPVFHTPEHKLVLANHSLQQLNILPLDRKNGRLSSVVDFISLCKTTMGKRELKRIITNPITDVEALTHQYNMVDHFIQQRETYADVRKQLIGICDLERMFRKFTYKRSTPHDILQMYDSLMVAKKVLAVAKKDEIYCAHPDFNKREIVKGLSTLLSNINDTFIIKQLRALSNDPYELHLFHKGLHTEIDTCEQSYYDAKEQVDALMAYLDGILRSLEKKSASTKYCKFHETEKSGCSIQITETRGARLKKALAGIVADVGSLYEITYRSNYHDGEERTFTIDLSTLTTKKRNSSTIITSGSVEALISTIDREKSRLRQLVKAECGQWMDDFLSMQTEYERVTSFVVQLDVFLCKAHLAHTYRYCKPSIDTTRERAFFSANQMRHMLIEHLNTSEIYVPNDISFDDVERNENGEKADSVNNGDHDTSTQRGVLLFGTNAVGKSSLIKSIGICVILAQAGFFVPCESFVFYPFTQLFTRILGNDNIFKGLSTFAVEMSELRTILEHADENSLVLGDELCSGTELGSAISIFVAGLMQLQERKASFMFATHFHEVTHMPEITEMVGVRMKHMSVHYDATIDGLVYDRVLKDGAGNNMYGLEVCKALNLPQDFISRAYEIRNRYSEDHENETVMVGTAKQSNYNAQKVKGDCELCGDKAVDVHHLHHQEWADANGGIARGAHKNNVANLMNVCQDCHDGFHSGHNKDKVFVRAKSTRGNVVVSVTG